VSRVLLVLALGLLGCDSCENEPCGDTTCRLDEMCCQGSCTVSGEREQFCATSCAEPTDSGCIARGDTSSAFDSTTASMPLECELVGDPDGMRRVRFELSAGLAAMDSFVATVTDVDAEHLVFESASETGQLFWVGPRLPDYFAIGEAIDVSVSGSEVSSMTSSKRVGFEVVDIPGGTVGVPVVFGEPACYRGGAIVRYCGPGVGEDPPLFGNELHYVFLAGGQLTAPFESYTSGTLVVTNVEALRDSTPEWDCLGEAPLLVGTGLFSYAFE